MYYNRWAWVAASALVLIALLPSRRAMPVFDGVLMGVLFSLLALTKMTFCVMLLPGVLFALLFQNRQREFYVLIGTGLVAVVLVAAILGVDFWRAYAFDLLNVSGSEVRPHTGFSFSHLVASPKYLPLTAVGLLAFYYLSRAGHRPQALGILILFPGFLYISWQNFGNDPVWLVSVLAVLLTYVSLGNTEDDGNTQKLAIVAVLAAMFILPWGLNMAMSPLRHATQDIAEYEPVLPERRSEARDIYVRRDRGFSMLAQTFQDDPGDAWDKNAGLIGRPAPRQIDGISFPRCEFMAGSMNWLMQITDDLTAMEIPEGSQFFTTDVLTSFWLYGPYEPLQNGAPWYYSDLSGIENADFLIVPKCGFAERIRQLIIQDVIDADLGAELYAQTDRVAVFTLP